MSRIVCFILGGVAAVTTLAIIALNCDTDKPKPPAEAKGNDTILAFVPVQGAVDLETKGKEDEPGGPPASIQGKDAGGVDENQPNKPVREQEGN